jgi:CRISPR-associated protein Cmr6
MLRQAIANVLDGAKAASTVHAGLWIDKMLPDKEPTSEAAGRHLREITKKHVPEGYALAFARTLQEWETLADRDELDIIEATSQSRIIIGLGAKGVLEMGIALDHTWGMPYLPGSALKGLCASAAHHFSEDPSWRKPPGWPAAAPSSDELTDFEILFGTTKNAGIVRFHDGWWKPSESNANANTTLPLDMDVMTVHHPNYYQIETSKIDNDSVTNAPSDFDSPTPVPFVSTQGVFLFALEGPKAWRERARELLKVAFEQLGIGAKTASGYGRMSIAHKKTSTQRRRDDKRDELQRVCQHFEKNRLSEVKRVVREALDLGLAPEVIADALRCVRDNDLRTRILRALNEDSTIDRARFAEVEALLQPSSPPPAPMPAREAPAPRQEKKIERIEGEFSVRCKLDRRNRNEYTVRFDNGEEREFRENVTTVDDDIARRLLDAKDWVRAEVEISKKRLTIRRLLP